MDNKTEYLGYCIQKGCVYSEQVTDTHYVIYAVDCNTKRKDFLISYDVKKEK